MAELMTTARQLWLAASACWPEVEASALARWAGLRSGAEPNPRTISAGPAEGAERSGVAVLSVTGPLYARSVGWGDSYEELAAKLDELAASPVRGVLLRMDSPGGEAANVEVAAAAVARLAARKPVWALADPDAYSAAYWIASQASELWVAAGGGVGSVGVIVRHMDQTERAKSLGVKVTEVTFGRKKAQFSSFRELADEDRERLEAMISQTGERFVAAVADGRGVAADVVLGTEAAVLTASEAVELGLADGVGSFGAVLEQMIAGMKAGAGPMAAALGPEGRSEGTEVQMAETNGAPSLPADAIGAAAGQGKPEQRDAGRPAAVTPRVDLNGVVAALGKCGLNDLSVAQDLQGSAASTEDAAEIGQLFAIAGKPDWMRAAIQTGRGLTGAALREQLLERRASESDQSQIRSAALPHEGLGLSASKRIDLSAGVDRFNARLTARQQGVA